MYLETDFASVVQPILDLIDNLSQTRDEQIVVLIPDILPSKSRYALLHNHIDFVLSSALRQRDDIVIARCRVSIAELAESTTSRSSSHAASAYDTDETTLGS